MEFPARRESTVAHSSVPWASLPPVAHHQNSDDKPIHEILPLLESRAFDANHLIRLFRLHASPPSILVAAASHLARSWPTQRGGTNKPIKALLAVFWAVPGDGDSGRSALFRAITKKQVIACHSQPRHTLSKLSGLRVCANQGPARNTEHATQWTPPAHRRVPNHIHRTFHPVHWDRGSLWARI
jgi:hypothetical protein